MRYTVLSRRAIIWWAVLITVIGIGMAVWLLLAYGRGDPQVQLDAIRTAGTIVVGTGGAAALLLAARRQRTAEIALKQKDRDQADAARAHALQVQVAEQTRRHQERVAAATEADAKARRITDLYTKAADQLGSDKAPIRLAGLYALERLAQDHVEQRQTIVNGLCAFLRMPFVLPGDPPADADTVLIAHQERTQEREVRLAAQRILAHHLHPGPDPDGPVETFWAELDLDLTGATLLNVDLDACHARTATFTRAHFTGNASFHGARFTGDAVFNDARFTGHTWFIGAEFAVAAVFSEARFTGDASFNNARFASDASFSGARFSGNASYRETRFIGRRTSFIGTNFGCDVWFTGAEFAGAAVFGFARFAGHTSFHGVRADDASFGMAMFSGGLPPEVAPFVSPPDEETGGGDEATG